MTSKSRMLLQMLNFVEAKFRALTVRHTLTSLTITVMLMMLIFSPTMSLINAQDQKQTLPASGFDADQALYQTVLQIKAETQVLPFSVLSDKADIEPHGPSSLSVTDNGNFLVANQTDNSVVEISRLDGSVLSKTIFETASALTDAVSFAGKLYAIDANDRQPIILTEGVVHETQAVADDKYRLTRTPSQVVAKLREDALPTRLSVRNGLLAVETITGESISALDGITSLRQAKDVPVVAPGNPFQANANQLHISIRGKELVRLTMPNPIAETTLLGVLSSGDFYVYVIELGGDHELLLDHKILHFDASGKLLDQARVPAHERSFAVPNGSTLTQDGIVYSLIPRENGDLDIVQLIFVQSLPDFALPAKAVPPEGDEQNEQSKTISVAALSLPQLTRAQIRTNATNFVNATVYHSAANIGTTSSCPTRVIPAYLRNRPAGNYQVAYSWGGADYPSDYQGKLNRGFLAGNAQSGYTASCSVAGVDCSGFVADVWQMPGHPFSTASLPGSGIVRSIAWSSLMTGDVLNYAGTHVMMYDRSDSNSVWVWEATTDYGTGRVGYNQRPWRDVPSTRYAAYRYNGLPSPIPRISAVSSWGVVYENGSATYTVNPGQSITFNFDSSRSVPNASQMSAWIWRVNGTVIGTQPSKSYTLGVGRHTVTLEVTNSEGGTATASLTIQINQVVIVPPPRIDLINPSYVRRGYGTWLAVYGANFQPSMRVQVRTSSGGPWPIASSGVSYVNSGLVRVYVVMGGSGTYSATLEIVQNGAIASRSFTVGS